MTHPLHGKISIILPCLNERQALPACIDELLKTISENRLTAEIIIVDNGSTDGSIGYVRERTLTTPSLRTINEPRRGYGAACLAGFEAATGDYLYLADADLSYDFSEIPLFIEALQNGNDLVVGNRFNKNIERGAMPFLHRYIGNPILSSIVRIFFSIKIHDIHCGARAITRDAYKKLSLRTRGMEFASEMIIQSSKQGLTMTEIPTHYRPRIGISKLQTFGDGWRHLRFILLYSPIYLFLIPGVTLMCLGIVSLMLLYFGKMNIFGVQLYVHPMFLASTLILLGYQIILYAGFSRIYAITHLGETDHFLERLFKKITIERAGALGIIVAVIGMIIYASIAYSWASSGFGTLNEIKNSIVALTFIVLGVQTIFSAFILSTLGIQEK